jgi:hypothetical protein
LFSTPYKGSAPEIADKKQEKAMPDKIKTNQARAFKKLDTFNQEKCSHINCRSSLETRNPVREEILKIISSRLENSTPRTQGQ